MTAPLSFETRVHLVLALVDIEQALAGNANPEVHGLIERARQDLHQGWPEAAHDALRWARRLLAGYTPGDAQ